MVKRLLLLSLVVLTFFTVAQAGISTAQGHGGQNVLCTEDPVTGCNIQLPVGGTTTAWVASDGATTIDPWNQGRTSSDWFGVNPGWVQTPGSFWSYCAGCGNPLPFPGADIYVNDETTELVGNWNFPGNVWNFTGVIRFEILEEPGGAGGPVSDLITIGNFGPGGDAGLEFNSLVPEPSSLLLLGSGLLSAVGVARRRFLK